MRIAINPGHKPGFFHGKKEPKMQRLRSPNTMDEIATIQPFQYNDPETGDRISISVSDLYATLRVNDREYFFIRETGEFDGSATVMHKGPLLIYRAGE